MKALRKVTDMKEGHIVTQERAEAGIALTKEMSTLHCQEEHHVHVFLLTETGICKIAPLMVTTMSKADMNVETMGQLAEDKTHTTEKDIHNHSTVNKATEKTNRPFVVNVRELESLPVSIHTTQTETKGRQATTKLPTVIEETPGIETPDTGTVDTEIQGIETVDTGIPDTETLDREIQVIETQTIEIADTETPDIETQDKEAPDIEIQDITSVNKTAATPDASLTTTDLLHPENGSISLSPLNTKR